MFIFVCYFISQKVNILHIHISRYDLSGAKPIYDIGVRHVTLDQLGS